MRGLSSLPIDERRRLGAEANRIKIALEAAYDAKRRQIEQARVEQVIEGERLDVTLPGPPLPRGRLHPITQTLRDVLYAFENMGFQVAEGPEIEWDYYNFEALRIPADHPARDMWDTLWIDHERDGKRICSFAPTRRRTRSASWRSTQPPIRVVVPGKCYRYEATDPTHEWMLTQVEGLAVDEGITMADLKGTLAEFARRIFGARAEGRASAATTSRSSSRASSCASTASSASGEGCRTCRRTGWIEILGAGMVHPEILANVGYDPERYTGFAFGMGVERIALLSHGVDDIRHFYANDLRFLRQF